MEQWFLWVLVATFLGGLHVFINKIGSVRGYNSNLLNSYSGIISGLIGFSVTSVTGELATLSWFLVAFAVINGGLYLWGSNLRMDAMRYIDTTILLPLHKFVGPLFALLIGVVWFGELLSLTEWLGVLFGMIVPLLLISRQENHRQNNLLLGLTLMAVSAGIVAVNAAANKWGTDIFSSVILLAAVSNFGSGILGLGLRRVRSWRQTAKPAPVDRRFFILAAVCGVVQFASFNTFLFAFATGGPLAIVYTIHSLYILIPIVLSIIFFNEHWNARKVIAIIASIAAIMLMR